MESFWDRLGLKGNPYDPKPLTLSEEDMKLFVGRNNELAQLNTLTSGGNGGIIIIEGDFGVGKTSFVNMFQYEKQKNEKILPSFESIELFENTDLVNFMLSVFSKMIFNLEKFDETNASKKHNIHSE